MKNQENIEVASLFESDAIYSVPEASGFKKERLSGDNEQNILIVVSGEGDIPVEEDELLRNILSALNLGITDVALLSLDTKESIPFSSLKREVDFSKLITFGVDPTQIALRMNYKKYKTFSLGEMKILVSDSLHALISDKKSRGELWTALKEMFEYY